MTVREAIRASLTGMTEQQRVHVAGRLGKSVSTLYQCGEPGMRCQLSAEQVATFCALTGNDAVLQAITRDTNEQMESERNRGQMHLPGTVTEFDLIREATDIPHAVANAFSDGIVTASEWRMIWRQVQEFIGAALRFGVGRKRTAKRAATLAGAE